MTESKKFKMSIRERVRATGESYCAARSVLLRRHEKALGQRAEVIAVAGMKGGIGRSTLAILIACEMHLRGERVLLVGLQPAVIPFGEPMQYPNTIQHWTTRTENSGFVGPASITIRDRMLASPEFAELTSGYSLVIVDCPRILEVQYAAMLGADTVLIPCSTASASVRAVDDARALIALGLRRNPNLVSKIVIANEQPRTSPRRIAALREAGSECGVDVLGVVLRDRVAFGNCLDAGRPLSAYAPGSKAFAELRALLDELFPSGSPARFEKWRSGDVQRRLDSLSYDEFSGVLQDMARFYRAYAIRAEPAWVVPGRSPRSV